MKKTIKRSMGILALVMMIAGLGVTIAYLTSKDEVRNTFVSGKVKITLTETATKGGSTKANSYKMYPGAVISKDPKVTVLKNSEEAYVYVQIDNELLNDGGISALTNIDKSKWTLLSTRLGTSIVKLYRYHKATSLKETDQVLPVFTQVTIPTAFENEDMTALNNKTIKVRAFAIQKNGLENGLTTADEQAIKAFEGIE